VTAIAGAVSLAPALGTLADGSEAAGIVLFVGVLPLLNGLADFLSVGLTRFLLRRGLVRGLGWSSGLDLLGGLAIFALLGMSVIAFVHFVRPQDGEAMLDLAAAFAAIRADPGAHWWLGFMLFSTLIPTVLHLSVLLAALWSWWPFALRRRTAKLGTSIYRFCGAGLPVAGGPEACASSIAAA